MRRLHRHRLLIVWIAIFAILGASSLRAFAPVLDTHALADDTVLHDFCLADADGDPGGPLASASAEHTDATHAAHTNHCPFCRIDFDAWDLPAPLRLPAGTPHVDVPAAVAATAVAAAPILRPGRPRGPPAST